LPLSPSPGRFWTPLLALVNRRGAAAGDEAMTAEISPGLPPDTALVEALPDPVLVIAAHEADDIIGRRIVFANAAARERFRILRPETLLVTAIRDPHVLEAVDEALFGVGSAEAIYELGGAQARVYRAQARPLGRKGDGQHLALVVFRDETELRQVERTRVDFLANASHELRTPLASLAGFIETLRGHARGDQAASDRFLGIMQVQAERMSRLIDDLMSLSRIELAEHIAPAGEADLATCAREVVEGLCPLAQARGVRFEVAAPAGLHVQGDRDQIVQVIQNLAENALKYAPDDSAVRIDVEGGLTAEVAALGGQSGANRLSLLTPDPGPRRYAAVRVAGSGDGIAREHLPRLTERFYRVEGQKSGERSGTGLGLAIVKHIVNRHRGGLVVESTPGEGATFTAYFPQAL
jgi:two-component system phosphate regulon sensor histidine kinase PhoR